MWTYLLRELSIFAFKCPSLLKIDDDAFFNTKRSLLVNLEKLSSVGRVPTENELRLRLDHLIPRDLRPAFKVLFDALERSWAPMGFSVLGGQNVVLFDCTKFFKSKKIHCRN